MKILTLFLIASFSLFSISLKGQAKPEGTTEITRWQYGKDAALSLTYDDGYINQFTVALPMMNKLNLPATFFIITGQLAGSKYHGEFIGRPVATIIKETTATSTGKPNFFERASAIPYLGYQGILDYHVRAGSLYESGKVEQAYALIDSVYEKVRNGEFKPGTRNVINTKGITWDDVREFEKEGHEFASHTVTHPMTPVLDEPNLLYELQNSREDILKQLGARATFSAECSYGIENPRVMEYALKIYPALRNRMPEPYLAELNRSSKLLPGSFNKEYVQWQRGATTKTNMALMKSWVDTVLTHRNNWLVLVFHGVDGNGYEALSHDILEEYFLYIKEKESNLWIATFGDVTRYMRERMSAKVSVSNTAKKINIRLNHSIDKIMYDVPLTLKTYLPVSWKLVQVKQGNKNQQLNTSKDENGTYVLYQAAPNAEPINLSVIQYPLTKNK